MPFDEQSRAEKSGAVPEGEAGNSFLAGVLGDWVDDEKAAAFNQDAHDVKASAENGGWAINPEGMDDYMKVCNTFLDKYDAMIREGRMLGRRAHLGSSRYAYAVADYNVEVAVGDDRSLIPNLELMADGYRQLQDALKIARHNYNENESAMVQRLGKLLPES